MGAFWGDGENITKLDHGNEGTTDLYTFKGRISWCVNHMSLKLLKRKQISLNPWRCLKGMSQVREQG
jgi:hypothetical protein